MSQHLGDVVGRGSPLELNTVQNSAAGPDAAISAAISREAISFGEAVADLAMDWQQPHLNDVTRLVEIVSGAVGVVPGCEHAALVVLDANCQLVAKAVSGPETAPMIALQNELGEGPCRETAATNVTIRAADVPRDLRWPRFAPRAEQLGIGSMLCTPLVVGDRSYGSLSMAAGKSNAFNSESESLAAIFATHAAIALADADRLIALQGALQARDVIGQAKGILMGRYSITADAAFSALVRESRNSNIKLRTVCETLCSTGRLPSGNIPAPATL